jgi:hypothetical protein
MRHHREKHRQNYNPPIQQPPGARTMPPPHEYPLPDPLYRMLISIDMLLNRDLYNGLFSPIAQDVPLKKNHSANFITMKNKKKNGVLS